ncbi:MAG: hypothetical protein B9S34_13235, partial [Opitutia bacterium Tous-C1TDCM]
VRVSFVMHPRDRKLVCWLIPYLTTFRADFRRGGDVFQRLLNNWVHTVDFFYATNWTGGTVDVRNAAPMNQITFTGNAAADTVWQSWDRQITPAPEPATYGLIFIGAALGLVVWQRRRAGVAVAAAARP